MHSFVQARVEKIPKQARQFEWIALVQERLLSRQYSRILASSSPLGRGDDHSIRHEDPLRPRREYFDIRVCIVVVVIVVSLSPILLTLGV